MRNKIIQFSEIQDVLAKEKNRRIVLTNGCFDILHIGHVRYLQEARSKGDLLFIGINSDESVKKLKGPQRPLNNENDRAEVIAALSCVDYVSIFNDRTADRLLKEVRPTLYVKGGDYTIDSLPERPTLIEYNIETQFIPFINGYSTTSIIEKSQS